MKTLVERTSFEIFFKAMVGIMSAFLVGHCFFFLPYDETSVSWCTLLISFSFNRFCQLEHNCGHVVFTEVLGAEFTISVIAFNHA